MIIINRMFKVNSPRIDVDTIVNENMSLMKEIRAKRIKFYKYSNQAEAHLSRN
jgi:hypothetical protein